MNQLFDKHGRTINYLRLAITDRCNLRCQYCMPEAGNKFVERKQLLTFKEMYRITRVLSELGVNKVRLTGGEPFVRHDFMNFLEMLSFNENLDEINITTNGVLLPKYLEEIEKLQKIKSINLSLDTLKSDRFETITRQDSFSKVMESFNFLKSSKKIKLKLNFVVQSDVNTDEIINFIELTKNENIAVRFIEEMPFNGIGQKDFNQLWDFKTILAHIQGHYSDINPIESTKSSTSVNYQIPTYKGTFGIIPAFTRTICNDCNRIRITSTGMFKNCLFDEGVFSVRDFLRNGANDQDLKELFINTVHHKPENGFVAEQNRNNLNISESMSNIGG
ncbi:MAG: GTP 3',8-cyclase MoaA [Flavobacteriaceae bacterium]|nr:GTP 3',8-cyclase MoaA [Flavobacteriaceae bacterium]